MRIPWRGTMGMAVFFFCLALVFPSSSAQEFDWGSDTNDVPAGTADGGAGGAAEATGPPKEALSCNGIFLTYTFVSREKVYPLVSNATAQAWSFKSQVTVLNTGVDELKSWKVFVGFQHQELLVSVDGAMVVDAEAMPARVGNGTFLMGYPHSDLKTAIETAGDFGQMQVEVELTGTLFGVKPGVTPMPKTVKLVNDGFKCPAPTRHDSQMLVCCKKDPKLKNKAPKTKFLPRQHGDLSLTYDVLQAYEGNYLAQVTIDNNHPLGRLDHWNLTWEWMRGEFIHDMRGAYTHKKDASECIYGPAGQFYKDFDFSNVANCQKKPIISDLPAELINDDKVGKLPFCCRNGSLLPTTMNVTKARSIFQLNVFKTPPDMNRTALNPPQNWHINGVLNPSYKCGTPLRVDSSEFPDPSGLQATSSAIASWQVTCNITRPKPKQARCCVSYSAYYAESVIPCNTCACGCDSVAQHCDANAKQLLLPSEALLVPFENRTLKARAWASLKHLYMPKKLPCPDNCGVSINWHVDTDYKTGWTVRITLFNWRDYPFEDWFTAIQMKKAFIGYENVYSFNGTKLPQLNNTLFFQGLKGLNYLVGEVNGTHPDKDPRVPGKQQSVISFLKKHTPGINIAQGDGFPTKVIFNGEECALPIELPKKSGGQRSQVNLMAAVMVAVMTFVLMMDRLH